MSRNTNEVPKPGSAKPQVPPLDLGNASPIPHLDSDGRHPPNEVMKKKSQKLQEKL